MKGEKAYIVIYSFMIEDLKLDPSSVLVFAYIYGFCLKYGVCDSSLAFISKKTGLSKRNVQRVLAELVEKNILYKVERDTKKGNIPNTYGVKGIDKLSTHRKGIDKMTIPNAEGIDKIAPEYRQDVHRGSHLCLNFLSCFIDVCFSFSVSIILS